MLRRPIALIMLAAFTASACRPTPAPTPQTTDARYSGTFAGGFRFPDDLIDALRTLGDAWAWADARALPAATA